MKKNLESAKYAAMMGITDGLDVRVAVWNRDDKSYTAKLNLTDYSQLSAIETHCELYEADVWEISYAPYSVDITLIDGGFDSMCEGL